MRHRDEYLKKAVEAAELAAAKRADLLSRRRNKQGIDVDLVSSGILPPACPYWALLLEGPEAICLMHPPFAESA